MVMSECVEERIAIRRHCGGYSEKEAVEISARENVTLTALQKRIVLLAEHQKEHAKPKPLRFQPGRFVVKDGKSMASGERYD